MRRYRLKSHVVIREPAAAWVEPGGEYEGDWSPGHPRHPGRITLFHPRNPDELYAVSERDVDVVG